VYSNLLPSYLLTSVEVPPISNPIDFLKPFSKATFENPTTPPAGPERIESFPEN